MTTSTTDAHTAALLERRQRLSEDIGRQQRLLASLRDRTAVAQRDRLTEVTADFDQQISTLSPWLAEKHARLIKQLRAELPKLVERGEEIPDVASLCKRAAIELVPRERELNKELNATRDRLDVIAGKLDATAVLKIELERMRVSPQTPPTAHSGWTNEELQTLREAYSITQAQRITNAVAAMRGEVAPEIGPLPAKPQGRKLTLEEWETAQRKRRGEE